MIRTISELRKVDWPIRDFIIGQGILRRASRMFVVGRYKAKKTFLTTQMGLELAAGHPFLSCFEVKQAKVLFVNAEVAEDSFVQERLLPMAEKYPEASETFFEYFTNYKLKFIESQREVWREMLSYTKADVMIVDPLSEVALGDENSKTDAQKVGDFINSLIDEFGVSVVLVHHEGKGMYYEGKKVSRGFDAFRGSSYWLGWADSAVSIQNYKETYFLDFLIRHSKDLDQMELSWDDESKLFVPAKEKAISTELIKDTLSHYPKGMLEQQVTADISRKGLVSEATVRRRIDELVKRGEVVREAWIEDKRKNVLRLL